MKEIKFILFVEKRNGVKMIKKAAAPSGKKFHPNVVAVLFVTVLNCCC